MESRAIESKHPFACYVKARSCKTDTKCKLPGENSEALTKAPVARQAENLDPADFDFGTPGQHVQPGFTKIGGKDSGYAGLLKGEDEHYKVSVDGYTNVVGDEKAITGKYQALTGLLRSSILCKTNCQMTVTIRDAA